MERGHGGTGDQTIPARAGGAPRREMSEAPDLSKETLPELIERQARKYGDKTFMTFGDGTSMSFEAFSVRVAAFRDLVSREGIRSGDAIALMMKNSLFYPVAWLGTISAGAVAVPINSRLGKDDAGFILKNSGAVAIVADDATADR